jgi:hypothetical protein
MLYACVERFDARGGRGNILGWDGEGIRFGHRGNHGRIVEVATVAKSPVLTRLHY